MLLRLGLVVMAVCLGVAPAAAWERPLFDFRGELPVPGGTFRLETRCLRETEGLRCRAESRGPAGRGFQFEGRLLLWPQERLETSGPASPTKPGAAVWF